MAAKVDAHVYFAVVTGIFDSDAQAKCIKMAVKDVYGSSSIASTLFGRD